MTCSNAPKPASDKQALDQLIDETLMMQEAKRQHALISDSEVDSELAKRASAVKLSGPQFQAAMRQAGFDPATFRQYLQANISWQRVVHARFRATVNITDQDVAAVVGKEKPAAEAQKNATEYVVQPVLFLIPKGSSGSLAAQRLKQAEEFRKSFQGCDRSVAQIGGTPGVVVQPNVRRDESKIPEPLKTELAKAEVGGTTSPQKIGEGYQVLGICGKNAIAGETEATVAARAELSDERGQLLARQYLRDLRSDAVIEYR
jgi:peptidyl-prolyl cis-trans isomerase SurA